MNLPMELHDKVAEKARELNCTITIWIMRAILERIQKEQEYE